MTEWYESDKGRALYGIESKSPAAAELRALGYRVEEFEGPAPAWADAPTTYVLRCLGVLPHGECSIPFDYKPFLGTRRAADWWVDRALRDILSWHNRPPCWSYAGAEDLFVEANQPPPAKVTETPGQAEALPEPGPEVTEAREASEAKPGQECAGVIVRPGHPPVSVRWRLDGDVVHVTVAVPGRIDSVSTAVTVGGVKP